jgi:hypothetical protein
MIREMYELDATTDQQKMGILLSLPMHVKTTKLSDYRPITLLNTDYKMLTRFIVNRFRPWLPEVLHADQHLGIAGSTVYDVLATLRDVVAYAKCTPTPVCVLTIAFATAFDRIAHDYIHETLRCHGFSERMTRWILNL